MDIVTVVIFLAFRKCKGEPADFIYSIKNRRFLFEISIPGVLAGLIPKKSLALGRVLPTVSIETLEPLVEDWPELGRIFLMQVSVDTETGKQLIRSAPIGERISIERLTDSENVFYLRIYPLAENEQLVRCI